MRPLRSDGVETGEGSTPSSNRRRTREWFEWILQHVQLAGQAVSADGVPGVGEAHARRAPRPRVQLLGASSWRCYAASLAAPSSCERFGEGGAAARASSRTSGSARRAARRWPAPTRIARGSSIARCSRRCWRAGSPGRRAGGSSVQAQAGESGLHGDRPVRDAVRLSALLADQGRGQAAWPAGPRRLSPQRGCRHRGEAA